MAKGTVSTEHLWPQPLAVMKDDHIPISVTNKSTPTTPYSPLHAGLDSSQLDQFFRPMTAGDAITSRYARPSIWDSYPLDSPTMDITTSEKDTFHFPTPIRKPMTANNSPRLDPTKMASIDTDFGISLTSLSSKSPFMSPLSSQYAITPVTAGSLPMTQPVRAHTTREWRSDEMQDARPKLSRWRSLGGLFGRKKPDIQTQSTIASTDRPKEPESRIAACEIGSKSSSAAQLKGRSQPSAGLFRRVTRKGTRVQGASPKSLKMQQEQEQSYAPLLAPHLDIHIPEAEMERYSVLFKKVGTLPNRSDSLLMRRQGTGNHVWPTTGSQLKPIDVPASRLIGRAKENPAQDAFPVRLPPQQALPSTPTKELPHISALLNRPRPIQRYNTAPVSLSVPNAKDPQLCATIESDEIDLNDQGNTPTPSSPASPSTPKDHASIPVWQAPASLRQRSRTNSWDHADVKATTSPDSTWELITVSKRLSSGDFSPTTEGPSDIGHVSMHSQDALDNPQVSIARSLSVTKAGNRSNLKPTRVNSKRKTKTVKQSQPESKDSPPPVPQKDFVDTEISNTVAVPTILVNRVASRKQDLQRDLTREIWGEHGLNAVESKVRENKTLTANLRVVDDDEVRKSVHAVIESA